MAIETYPMSCFYLYEVALEAIYNLMLKLQALWFQKSFYKIFLVAIIFGGKTKTILSLVNTFLIFKSWFKTL